MFADLASWLMALIGPLAARVMLSLGLGVVTLTGLDTAISSALSQAKAAFGGMPSDVLMIVAKFGFFDFMSITSGGVISGLVWMELKKIAVVGAGQGTGSAS